MQVLLQVLDLFGVGVFAVSGALAAGKRRMDLFGAVALAAGVGGIIAVVMGVMTGVVGGMIRDVLSGEVPLILRKEIYATASLCGAIVLVVLVGTIEIRGAAILASLVVTLGLHLSAIKWRLSLPMFVARSQDK